MHSHINTVTGTITPDQLGRVLMHEHVFVEYGGPSADCLPSGRTFKAIAARCAGFAEGIKKRGVATVVDPTTVDLGRNPLLLKEVAARTGLTIICATGIYSTGDDLRIRRELGGSTDAVSELFIKELTEGIDDTGIQAGIIKVVTGHPVIIEEERELLLAAARASVATGAPIITHTEGVLGVEQQNILGGAGVPLHRIIIGHSCLSRDFKYHTQIIRGGSYVAFDRFGMPDMPDETRAASLQKLLDAGYASRLMVSHDSVWYWANGPSIGTGAYKHWVPTNFFERVIPMLRFGGTADEQIETMLTENPRRFFEGEMPR
jgi:phosphotriesterase-related protein